MILQVEDYHSFPNPNQKSLSLDVPYIYNFPLLYGVQVLLEDKTIGI